MDCYSNDTTWPWYAGIAPASFLVVNDVKGGRELIHGGARLSDTERRTLVAGFRALYASDPPRTGGGG